MGEFQISNLPMILIAIAIICMGVLGYFEIKKLYLKLSEIDTKLDEITESLTKRPISQQQMQMPSGQQVQMPSGQQMQIPPHILEQRRMMMLRQQQQQQQQSRNNMEIEKEELNLDKREGKEEEKEDNNSYDDELEERSESSSRSSNDDDIISKENDNSDIISKDEEDDNISHTTEMTIELDNEFKHLSVKELKDLCHENNLQVSGNKSKLISRLLENKNSDN